MGEELAREYDMMLRLVDGTEVAGGTLTTRRARGIGDTVNLPKRHDGTSEAGKGHVWRIVSGGADEPILLLEYVLPNA